MTTASGRDLRMAATVSRIRRNRRGACGNTSGEARDSQFGQRHETVHALVPHLLATDPGDPQLRAGALAQGPGISAAPSISPDGSPAMMNRKGADLASVAIAGQ